MTRFLRRRVGLTAWGWWVALFVALALLGAASAGLARAQEADDPPRYAPSSRAARYAANGATLRERAVAHGVSPWLLEQMGICESKLDPGAVGDYGHSHGLVQLNDAATGLLWHFHAQGYASAYDAWESADYLARVASGEFAGEGVTLKRWSCFWVVSR